MTLNDEELAQISESEITSQCFFPKVNSPQNKDQDLLSWENEAFLMLKPGEEDSIRSHNSSKKIDANIKFGRSKVSALMITSLAGEYSNLTTPRLI